MTNGQLRVWIKVADQGGTVDADAICAEIRQQRMQNVFRLLKDAGIEGIETYHKKWQMLDRLRSRLTAFARAKERNSV